MQLLMDVLYPLWNDWDDDNDPTTPLRPAIQSYTIPLEQHIVQKTNEFINDLESRISLMSEVEVKNEMELFQNEMSKLAYDCYMAERFPLSQYSEWKIGEYYKNGEIITYNGKDWINKYNHTSNEVWYPGAPDLWFWEELKN